jgi:hypothetical protein
MVGVCFGNITKGGFNCKRAKRDGVSLTNRGKGRGL